MAKVSRNPENENIINVGSNYRIESGPPLITAVATKDLLDDNETAPHYAVGNRDAVGKPIKMGEEMTYLDWGGNQRQGERVFYVYKKTPVNNTDEYVDGKPNPYFVPQHIREAESDNRTVYDYIWAEVAVVATEDEAIGFAQSEGA